MGNLTDVRLNLSAQSQTYSQFAALRQDVANLTRFTQVYFDETSTNELPENIPLQGGADATPAPPIPPPPGVQARLFEIDPETLKAAQTHKTISKVLLGVGGVLLVAGLTTFTVGALKDSNLSESPSGIAGVTISLSAFPLLIAGILERSKGKNYLK